MLAMSTVYSLQPDYKAKGILFAKIARQAAEKNYGNFSLQLVQCRLLIGLYYFAHGHSGEAWDFGGSAFRAVAGLRLNLERDIIDLGDDERLDYGLNKHSLAECQRRTYWSAFIMDVSSFCMGTLDTSLITFSGIAAIAQGTLQYSAKRTPLFDCHAVKKCMKARRKPQLHTSTTA